MTRREYHSNNGSNVLGVAILSALAGAAAVFLSDRKNREMVKEKANRLVEDGKETIENAENTTRRKASEKLEEASKRVEKKK